MSKKLGKVEKPLVEKFKEKRKLYCVPLIFSDKDALKNYLEIFNRYWDEVAEHITNLEKAGKVKKIYHESISIGGEDGLQAIKEINKRSYQLVNSKYAQGIELQALEDKDLFNEYMDWSMCRLVIGRSQKVVNKIQEFYQKANEKRDEYVAKQIDNTLKKGEAGMLIMSDEYRMRIQSRLPSDIQIFLVNPPALNDIQQWLRNQLRKRISQPE